MARWMRALSVDREDYYATGRPTNLMEQFEHYLKSHEHCPSIDPTDASGRAGHGLAFLKPSLSVVYSTPEGPKVDVSRAKQRTTQVPAVTDPNRVVSEQSPRSI
eukprot:1922823-Lingulodinium_polyedra.AAC.1